MGFFVTGLIIVNAFAIQFRDAFSFKLMMGAGILSSESDAERSHTHDHVQRSSNLATYGQSYAILKLSALPCRIFAAQNLTLVLPRPLQVSRLRISARNRKQNGRLLRSRSKPRSIWPTRANLVGNAGRRSCREVAETAEASVETDAANSTVVRSGHAIRRWKALVERFPTICLTIRESVIWL